MNKETRIKKIEEIKKQKPFGRLEIPWEDALTPMDIHKIPLEYLLYNKYNGRILSRTKSLESQKHEIDVESDGGRKLIEELLWESNRVRNKQTLESIDKIGQEKIGIITRDGVIIDGNRRAMLLKRSGKYDYFKAVILDVTQEENPLEIEKLETTFQMGEDEKLGYNPIEKYLKAMGIYKKLSGREYDAKNEDPEAMKKLGDWMGEPISEIKKYLMTMNTMDEYLLYLEYDGIYTQLDGREEQFIGLTKWMAKYYGEESGDAFSGYKNSDVDDLKIIAFDYIRIKYKNEDFRQIATGRSENHFFGDKQIWKDFRDYHFQQMDRVKDKEEKIDYDSEGLEAHLNDRDDKFWKLTLNEQGRSFLDENVDAHYEQLRNKQAKNEPLKLVSTAARAIDAIDRSSKAFSGPGVMEQIEELNKKTSEMLIDKSPKRILSQVIRLLTSIVLDKSSDPKDELLNKVKEIEQISYQMEKEIKKTK